MKMHIYMNRYPKEYFASGSTQGVKMIIEKDIKYIPAKFAFSILFRLGWVIGLFKIWRPRNAIEKYTTVTKHGTGERANIGVNDPKTILKMKKRVGSKNTVLLFSYMFS